MPQYVARHSRNAAGAWDYDIGQPFEASDDAEAWQKANDWSASASAVLFQATHLELVKDGEIVKLRPLADFI